MIKTPSPDTHAYGGTRSHGLPLGLLYLHAYLRKHNIPATILDPEAEGIGDREIVALARRHEPLLVGIYCLTANYPLARELAGRIKRDLPDVPIVLGGPQATAATETILQLDADLFDFLCIGEGEETICDLYQALRIGRIPRETAGLAFKAGGELVATPAREYIADLDTVPFPSRDQVDLTLYNMKGNLYRHGPSTTMITSRGCPFKCNYCQSKHVLGKKLRYHSADYVVAEIEELHGRYGIRYISFVDDLFTTNRKRLEEICQGITSRGLDIRFWCMARAEMIDESVIETLKSGGLDSLSIGVESGDDDILKDIGKENNREQTVKAFELLKKHRIENHAFFMIGFYHDTHQSVRKTIDFALELDPDFATFAIMAPFPGTEVFEKYYKDAIDLTDPSNWHRFQALGGRHPGFDGKYLSKEQIGNYRDLAFRKFFLRPSKLLALLKRVNSMSQLREYARASRLVLRGHGR